jgi:CheY-like chemotaxis protein/Tfp pilus assembly protein PilZ
MAEPATQKENPQSGDRKKRLLVVVDSDNAHLYYTSILLQRLEYNIHTSKTAEDALEIMNLTHPALVLSEVSLTGMDGMELLKKIKQTPQTFAVPVIILTASKDPAVKETCLREGCSAFLQKPIDPDVLYPAIQKATETTPRKYIRLNTCLNVNIGDDRAGAPSASGDYITALSENGMYVSTNKPLATGIQVPVTIFLENAKIKADGMVLYSFNRGEGPLKTPGMGIKFMRISSEDQSLIRIFIKRELTKGLTPGQIGKTIL